MSLVADNLRPEDEAEVRDILGLEPEEAFKRARIHSPVWAGIGRKGNPIVLFGVTSTRNPAVGYVWLSATPEILENRIRFLRTAMDVVHLLHDQFYPVLWTLSDARNSLHHHWLDWMGFQSLGERVLEGFTFQEFMRTET